MEQACHELDLSFAQSTGSLDNGGGGGGGASFDKYSSAIHRLFRLKEEAEKQHQVVVLLDQLATFLALTVPEGSSSIEQVRNEANVQKKTHQDMVKLQ